MQAASLLASSPRFKSEHYGFSVLLSMTHAGMLERLEGWTFKKAEKPLQETMELL